MIYVFISEFSIHCTDRFCHEGTFTVLPEKLCQPCRAEAPPQQHERTRSANVRRVNCTRQVLRSNHRMELIARHPYLYWTRPRGVKLWELITGMPALMPRSMPRS
jgi:hypothetical protein